MDQYEDKNLLSDSKNSEQDLLKDIEEIQDSTTHDLEQSLNIEAFSNNTAVSDSLLSDSNISDFHISDSRVAELLESEEEKENIPEEQEEQEVSPNSQSFTLECSKNEEDEFNFEKELPATPCDTNPNEQDLLMNFSTSHFQAEDVTEEVVKDVVQDLVNVAPPQETSHEEFEVEMIGSTDEKTVEDVEPQIAEAQETIELTKEEIVEEPVEQQKEASLPCEEPHVAVAASLIEHVAQRIVPVGKVSVAPEELPSHQVQPVEEVNEPKTRSVKSSKPCSGKSFALCKRIWTRKILGGLLCFFFLLPPRGNNRWQTSSITS